MNIFYLHEDQHECVKMYCDQHVIKMILETAQMLSTAHHVLDNGSSVISDRIYKKTHVNHPCSFWVRQNKSNYMWTYILLVELLNEYEYRFEKLHKTGQLQGVLCRIPKRISGGELTDPPNCTPYKDRDIIEAYKKFYEDKAIEWITRDTGRRFNMKWTRRDIPEFMEPLTVLEYI